MTKRIITIEATELTSMYKVKPKTSHKRRLQQAFSTPPSLNILQKSVVLPIKLVTERVSDVTTAHPEMMRTAATVLALTIVYQLMLQYNVSVLF